MTQQHSTQQDVLQAFAAAHEAINQKIATLQSLANQRFGFAQASLNWSHVAELGRVNQGLDDLLAIFTEKV